MDAIDGMSLDDQVSLLIGRAARQDVELELVMQRAYQELAGVPYDDPAPDRFDPLWKACVRVLPASPLPKELHSLAGESLQVAKNAHDARNRSVHDLWRPEQGNTNRYLAVPFDGGAQGVPLDARTVDEFRQVVQHLQIAQHRVGAIYWILLGLRAPAPDGFEGMNQLMLRGEFVLNQDGSAEYEWPRADA